mgnify:CR=1 FL=1
MPFLFIFSSILIPLLFFAKYHIRPGFHLVQHRAAVSSGAHFLLFSLFIQDAQHFRFYVSAVRLHNFNRFPDRNLFLCSILHNPS